MERILSILFLVVIVMFLVPTGLVLASQNAVPGDSTYSIKRSLEKVILSLASLHPSTKAYFHADLMNRRYKEAVALIEKGANVTESLQELVAQTGTAAQIATSLTDKGQKEQYINQLSKNIEQYEVSLSQLENKVVPTPTQPTPTAPAISTPGPSPQVIPTPLPVPVPSGTGPADGGELAPSPKPTPSPAQATFCIQDVKTCPDGSFVGRDTNNNCEFFPCPKVSPIPQPTPGPSLILSPSPTPKLPTIDREKEEKRKQIENTRHELAEIKKRLKEEKEKIDHKPTQPTKIDDNTVDSKDGKGKPKKED